MSKQQGHSEEGTIFLYSSKSFSIVSAFPLVQLLVPENNKDISSVQDIQKPQAKRSMSELSNPVWKLLKGNKHHSC